MAKRPIRPPDAKLFLASTGKGRSIIKFKKNHVVYSQGSPSDAVFYVQKGKIRVSVVSDRGKEAIVSVLGPGDFFGEGSISGQSLRIGTVAAMTEAVIVRVEKAEMLRLLQKNAVFSKLFMTHLLKRAMRVEADLIDQLVQFQRAASGRAPSDFGELRQ